MANNQQVLDKEYIKRSIVGKLQRYNGRTLEEATDQQIYQALASTIRDQIMKKWVESKEKNKNDEGKKLYYLSVEFLTGRSLQCNALNLCSMSNVRDALMDLHINWRHIIREEPEPGLGNGGLGRLAACFLDSLASLNLPAMGCTIRYEYGLFRQKIVSGQQVELPDNWLENGNVWEVPCPDDTMKVQFGGSVRCVEDEKGMHFFQENTNTVLAMPYDMPVAGYDCETVNTLRMWSARSQQDNIDLDAFSSGNYKKALEQDLAVAISKVLYPEDNHVEGKKLRLQQHYFFVSATLQYAIRDFKRRFGTHFELLPEKVVFHINDTHPSFAIPELMRILMDEEGLGWEEAHAITRKCIAYTNHTVMSEALEKWPEQMVKEQLPRIYMILEELNRRLCDALWQKFPGEWDRIGHMAILAYGQVHMANLCVAECFSVNGVSKLHGEILKQDTFKDYYTLQPEKFSYITNGITHRRWLMACNTHLRNLICEAIGDKWFKEPERLVELVPFADDAAFRDKFADIKHFNKHQFNRMLEVRQHMTVSEDMMYDVQCKRLHEYKRQMLNALHIHVLYNRIVDDPSFTMTPRLFIFAAKASPGYEKAKMIIRYILALSKMIDQNPRAREMLRIIFVENYNVSAAETIIPAADLSEQLSTAGKEASGTGNMKFMMNGAVTIGTMDGANVEIYEQVGADNIYIFGMRADTVSALERSGGYNPMNIFENNAEIRKAMTQMIDGTFPADAASALQGLYHDLLFNDRYFVLKDFGSYSMAQRRIAEDYNNKEKWVRMAVLNTAHSGIFSSDRTIREYNEKIWHLK